MATVAFDFDDTLWFSGEHLDDQGAFIPEGWNPLVLAAVKMHLAQGDRVVVVTSRFSDEAQAARRKLRERGLDLDVFSSPGMDGHPTKSESLAALGATTHFDDWVDDPDLQAARAAGIELVEVWAGFTDV